MYQASSVGTGGGAASSPTNPPSQSLSARSPQESLGRADVEQHTPYPVQLAEHIVKAQRSPEEIEKNRTAALRRKFDKTHTDLPLLRPLQVAALAALRTSGWDSSIIVMPTGSGKSRLIWSFRCLTECAIIFAPYRLLVDQLEAVMTEHGQTFRWPLTQHQGSVELLLSNAQFVVTSFENAPECIGLITQLKERCRLGPIWVDEVIGICQNRALLVIEHSGTHTQNCRQLQGGARQLLEFGSTFEAGWYCSKNYWPYSYDAH